MLGTSHFQWTKNRKTAPEPAASDDFDECLDECDFMTECLSIVPNCYYFNFSIHDNDSLFLFLVILVKYYI